MGPDEFGELIVSAFRMLRDRSADAACLRSQRAVRPGTVRLKDRFCEFKFVSRGSSDKTYRCQRRFTGEELLCHQIRKDCIGSPADHMRSELALLRNIDNPHLPSVVESFEDFNSVYFVAEISEGMELMTFLQDQQHVGLGISQTWVCQVMRQVLEALRYCHELRPHSIVHGELRLASLVLASTSDFGLRPHVIVSDLGLAGLPPSPPPRSEDEAAEAAVPEPLPRHALVCPKLDIWSAGCLLALLLTGEHPTGRSDIGGPLVPAGDEPEALEGGALQWLSADVRHLCAQMVAKEPRLRPEASVCLGHPWFADHPAVAAQRMVPAAALGKLVQLHARSQLRQVVTEHVVTKLSDSPFTCISAARTVMRALADDSVDLPSLFGRLGVSPDGVKGVFQAFGSNGDYSELATKCAELAEDLLDHALWRVFTAAGEDGRGILGVEELTRALQDEDVLNQRRQREVDQHTEAHSAGVNGHAKDFEHPTGGGAQASVEEMVKRVAAGRHEVTFEELKSAIIRAQTGVDAQARQQDAHL